MGVKTLVVLSHLISSCFALIVSQTQTKKLVKEVRKYNMPSILILGSGLIAAIFGTFSILNKGDTILTEVKQKQTK
jgi:hypothetical protein